ncbi:zinc finger BED domain-containing protein RICESLEEPER 2-like [Mercurialis annua]|uniref:zinc finger BED domain-containing protein RICESLEEPER 2-like n=1 Tax=Mercurialis annua TaxID=3986 RepID=UPI00215EDCF6|nr:zinc finger BED domain-containing protein RICESLEEPER 2-like [Mercurialis annua]
MHSGRFFQLQSCTLSGASSFFIALPPRTRSNAFSCFHLALPIFFHLSLAASHNVSLTDQRKDSSNTMSNATTDMEIDGTESNAAVDASNSQPSVTSEDTSKKKRKAMDTRSVVWDHFEKTKCNYFLRQYACHSKRNCTSNLKNHIPACMKNPHRHQTRQALINLQPAICDDGVGDKMGTLNSWKFDQEAIRESLAFMIILDELPFKFVEGEGFRRFISCACPKFKIPSRWTVTRDCFQLYLDERIRLKNFMKQNCQRISLTTDTWTSIQRINYMCITAHFIDTNWRLHKKVLSFVPIFSHKGDAIGKAIETCLLEWGITNVFSVTDDNASSNDVAISYLKRRIINWGNHVADCKYVHMRCIAHIINLVATEGLKDVNPSVKRSAEIEGIGCQSSLCLDVITRWNSTFLMLKRAIKFEKAFDNYNEQESNFKRDLGEDGVPSSLDWKCGTLMTSLLEHFYNVTLRISGSLYVTSNTFFSEISDLSCILNEWKDCAELDVRQLGDSMKGKFDKYWGDPEKMNKLIFFAAVLDPREKFKYMEYSFSLMYGNVKGLSLFSSVKNELFRLFNEYKDKYHSNEGSLSTSSSYEESSKKPTSILRAKYKKEKRESGSSFNKKNELDIYLDETILEDVDELDIFKWWKLNSERFPILSRMAQDILDVPISTVASESTFISGGRILDAFRSSLTPKIVEGLICGQDLLRESKEPLCVEQLIDEIENIEKDLPKPERKRYIFVSEDVDLLFLIYEDECSIVAAAVLKI